MATRILRPALSLRFQRLQRLSTQADSSIPLGSPPPQQSFFRRNRGRFVWTVTALGLGAVAGNFITHTISPPALPDAGTPGDKMLIADLNQRIDNEFKVQVLRGKCLGVAKQLKGQPGGWVELIKSEKDTQDLKGTLAAAKALGVERLFWNRDLEKLVAVVWFGGSVSGWPGVTHGGMIATQMVEKIGMLASLMHGHHKASAAATPQRMPGTGNHAKLLLPAEDYEEPEELSLSYVKPTYANGFYVVRVSPSLPLDHDPAHIVPQEPQSGKHNYEATLETMDARILVKAKARVAAGSSLQQMERKVEDAASWTYDQFRQWMWPSRQSASTE